MRHSSCERFVCLTDMDGEFEPGIEIQPFALPYRNYFSICEIFRPDLDLGRAFFTGLDTIITGSLDEIMGYGGQYGLLNNVPRHRLRRKAWRDFWPRVRFGNGVVMWAPEVGRQLWETYIEQPEHWHRTTVMPGHKAGSEMAFMCEQAPVTPDALDSLYPDQIVSFRRGGIKKHKRVKNARIVYFHGFDKPHTIAGHPVVRSHWI